jgi:phosphoribosyl 1,2-cyclic phosphodiesterase
VLRFCSLGSGSSGNALVVEARVGLFTTRLLVDNGFPFAALQRRLARAGLTLPDLDAVLLTHEHADHVGGVAALLRRTSLPVYASAGTAAAAQLKRAGRWRPLRAGVSVDLGGVAVHPFAVPHDASEPLQFVFDDGACRLGVVTDLGAPTAAVAAALGGVAALVLECNHDIELLLGGRYPPFLKQRIAGAQGHLSNAQAADLLARLDRSALRQVVAAHLSRENNRPQLARAALAAVLGCAAAEVRVADQEQGIGWTEV